jgi:hypothetical protein
MDINQANSILAADQAAEPETVAAIEAEQPEQAAEPEQTAESEQAAEGEPQEGEEHKSAPQTVPLAVHIRERERFKAERLAFQQQQQIVNERLAQLFAAQQQAKQEPEPDPDTDPLGYQIHLQKQTAEQLRKMQEETLQERQQRAAMEQQQRAVQYVAEKVNQDEKAFLERAPDYKEAIAHARNVKFAEYTALGMTEEQASQRLQQDAWALSIFAAENGLNAAEYAYQVSQALGYKPGARGTNSLEMRQKGQKVAVGGGAGGKKSAPTFADLAAMSNDEFARLTKGDNWQKFAGS